MLLPSEYFQNLKPFPEKQVFIGITGGIGSGKSAVAEIIRHAGYTVFSADDIGRELTNSNDDIKTRVNAEFGQMYHPDGTIDKMRMATLVFGNTPAQLEALKRLNAIIHPAVWKTVAERTKSAFERGEEIVFNETALLFEAGAEAVYDLIIVVDAPEDVRIQRLSEGRNIAPEEARRRIQAQIPAEEKARRAHFVVQNNGSREDLQGATMHVLRQIQQHRSSPPSI
jgi:dephospho-CoA kinase